MPELRKDPIVDRWVIIATERWKRPSDFQVNRELPGRGALCPFCPGNEALTPSEVLAYRPEAGRANGPGWTLRVVPNKFPALQIEGALNREGVGMFDKMNGVGAHEVVIESPDHKMTLSTMPEKVLENTFWAYRDRILDLKKDGRLRYILMFKNHGVEAGASLEHTHSQLIALPIIPSHVLDELNGSREHFAEKERCIYCDILKQEINDGARVVCENGDFACIAPFAPRFPFEVWVLPKAHASNFRKPRNPTSSRWPEFSRKSCAASTRPQHAPLQLHPPHRAAARQGRRVPPLALRDHAQAHGGGGFRARLGLLHQPDAAGGSREVFARGGSVGKVKSPSPHFSKGDGGIS